ncbi:MAG: carboxypeptidase regulatory-like domain-containing protein [Deltaproteobacteria bacterium]|nr:carboxypeptidase regulatory-like domain-containing protein [Deltaproteobacteria bacterium]
MRRRLLASAAVPCAAGVLLSACGAAPAHLAGRVVHDGSPLKGATVTVEEGSGRVKEVTVSGDDGRYAFPPLRPGAYRLRAASEGTLPLVAVAGKSPLWLAPGASAWVGLQSVPREEPTRRPLPEAQPGFGALSGGVLWKGEPVVGAVVYLYLDEDENLKGPGFRQSFPTQQDGAYFVDELPEGAYYVAVRRREASSPLGPVREGDLYGVASANPVRVNSGEEAVLALHVARKEKEEDSGQDLLALTGTGIRGSVLDEGGRPVPDAYVFAYRDRTIGHGMPDFVAVSKGPAGTFALPLGEGGLFYLGARERTGGSPLPGERFGLYEGSPDHSLQVAKGRIVQGVTIVVRQVLEP